MKNSNLVWLI
nr:unnamed protein product [Callosobruchus analis]